MTRPIGAGQGALVVLVLVFLQAIPSAAQDATWTTLEPMPFPVAEEAVAAIGKKIYSAGGFQESSQALRIYEPETGQWSRGADLPFQTHHAGIATVGGLLFLFGGTETETARVSIYDPSSDAWTQGRDMPTPRTAAAVAVIRKRIHVIGGSNGIFFGIAKRAHEVYDPATDTWESKAPLPNPVEHAAAGAIGGKIYVVGGRNDFTLTRDTQIYDPIADTWSKGARLARATSGMGAAVYKDKMYLFGGEDNLPQVVLDDLQRYDPATDRWEVLAKGPSHLHGIGAATLGNAIYFLGGCAIANRAEGSRHFYRLSFAHDDSTNPAQLAPPSHLTAVARSSSKVKLKWKDNSQTETSFLVQLKRKGKKWRRVATLSPNVRRLVISGLSPGVAYSFRVRAHEGHRKSAYSNIARVTMPE